MRLSGAADFRILGWLAARFEAGVLRSRPIGLGSFCIFSTLAGEGRWRLGKPLRSFDLLGNRVEFVSLSDCGALTTCEE